ncbi:MAG: glycosyltransferase family 9 protein [Bacteroidia bacterium]|nr:glycosyltransferase family 9 protein [Bacteroidia bacterium]
MERYAKTLEPLGCKLDGEGLDFFCGEAAEKSADEILGECNFSSQPVAMVLGGNFATKKWPAEYAAPLLNQLGQAVILFGGPAEAAEAGQIAADLQVPFLNAAGRFDLLTSAALLRKCRLSIANDTGFMHISAAFGLRTVSIWGNTVPEFGMYPYHTEHLILEEKGLACRPCSKLGHAACPKGHFDCMRRITPERVLGEMRRVGWV